MDASAFFSSGPSQQQQQQGQGHAPQQSAQFYGGSGGYAGGGTMMGRANSMESDSEFETLDINAPPTHHHHGNATSVGGGSTAATNSGNNNSNNGGEAANFFGGQQQQQYGNQYQASSGPENFSMASSGPENFSMPSSSAGAYTNSNQNYSNNSNYIGSNNNYNASNNSNHSNNYSNQEAPMEYEGVALQTALNTFTAVGRLGGGLASNVIGGSSRLIGGVSVTSGVGSVVGGAKNVVGGASGMGNSVTSGMGTMMKGIGNFASGLVGVGEEDEQISMAMAQWVQQQQQGSGNGNVGQGQGNGNGGQGNGQGNVGQGQQQQQQHVHEGYLHQEHRHQQHPQQQPQQQPQYAQPQPQQGYSQTNNTAQQVFNAPSPLSTPQFGATRNTTTTAATVGPPAMSLGVPATAAIVPPPSHHVQNSIMDNSQGAYPQQQQPPTMQQYPTEQQYPTMESVPAPPGQYAAVSSNMVSSEMSRMSSNASAADVFGGSSSVAAPVSRMASDASAADVFGTTTTTAPVSRMASDASAADAFGGSFSVAAPVSGITSDASAADVFGSATTTAAAASENGNSFAENVFEGTTTAATNVFGGGATSTNENTSAGGTTYPPTTAEEVLGGNEATEIPVAVESIETPPLPEGWAKGNDEASGNPYYYNTVTGESSWVLPEDKSNAAASTEEGNLAAAGGVDTLTNAEEIKEHPEIVHRRSSNQLSSLECAEHDPNFQYSDPLVGSAVAPATTTTNAVAKPPVTGNVLAMEIGNYHPPTAMVTMMDQQQDLNVSASVDVPSANGPVEMAPVAVKEEVKEVVDATPEMEMFEGTSIQQETPPLAASSNTSTIASSPAEPTEKHTITSSLAPPEKRPTVATSNTHRRFQLNLPKKASLPLPPPRNKKASSSVSGGGSLGSTSRKKKLSSSPFRKPPPMEVSATPRFHVPPPAGGSSVGSGGSGSHHHYPLPKAATPGSTSVLTASPLPTPRVLDDGESPLLPAASTSAVVEPKVVDTTESEPDVPKNASPDAPAADDGDKVPTEEPKVAEASIGTESTPPVVFQPLELDQIVEAVATPSEEFKMELPKKEVNYNAGEDIVNNVASTMTQGVMHDAVLHVASSAVNREVPPPTYSLTTRPIYHKDELPKAESSLFTEDGASDYQSTLRDDDLPPMSDNNEDDDEVLLSVESEVAPTQDESEKLDAASDTPKEEEFREVSGNAMVSSSVATEYPMSDYQEQVTDEDFVVVDSSDVDNNVVPVSSSPWVETMDPASGQTYYYNQENGETSWQLPIESVENVPVAAANEETVDNEETGESTWDKPSIKEAPDASPEDEVPADDIGAAEAEEVENNANNQQQIDGVFEEPASMADDANESPSPEVSPMADHVVEESVPADDANNEHKVVVEPEITEDEAPLLPDGWVKGIDEASGNPYYYNSVTGESSWDLPSASTEQGNVAVESAPVVTLSNAEEEINVTDTSNEHPKVEVEHEEVAQVNVNEAAQVHNDSPAEGQVEEESLQESEVSYVGPLPAGWIEANDPSGRVFYFNSSTGQSSWERPKSVTPEKVEVVDTSVKTEDDAQIQIENLVLAEESVAPLEDDEDNLSFESLPPGWIETKDPASGQIYFYNEKTDESSWSRPIDPAVNVASEVESEVKDESDIALPETVEEPVPSEASIIDEANIALADQKPVEEPRVNSEAVHEGSTYDSLSRPIMETVDGQDEIAFPVDSALVPEESIPEGNDADLDLQESHANEFVEESTTAEEIVPLSEEELPAGWLSSIDETTGKIFYYNEETGESTWDKPSIKDAPDASPEDEVPADDIADAEAEEVENNANNQQQIEGVLEEPASMADDANESPSPEVSPMTDHVVEESVPANDAHESLIVEPEITEDEAPLLPDGWVKGIDEASGNPYYYNSVTGESSWDLPSASTEQGHVAVESATVDVEDEVPADDIAAAESEEVENNANNQQQIEGVLEEPAPVEETVRPSSDELPPGWSSSVDEASGNIFYYNDEGITSWDKPSIEGSRDEAKPEDGTSVDKITEHQEEVEDLTDGSGEPQGGETDVDPQTSGLPHGWKELQDEATGNTYYWNEHTNETSWDYPHATADEDANAADVLTETEEKGVSEEVAEDEHISEQVASDQDGGDGTTEPQPNENCYDIPEGWVATVDETSGNTYYYHEQTNETSWDRPVAETKPDLPFATPKLAQRCRPAHAIATFGFGGRLCVMMPQVAASLSSTVSQPSSSDHPTMRRGPVVIHRVKDLIPRGHKFSIPSSSDSDTVGPLVKAKEKDVVSFLRQRSASPENLIWNLINIAAQNKGRLKNGDDVVDGGPEEAIVDLLLSVETSKKSSHSNAPSVQSTNSDLNDVQDLLLRGDRDRAVVEALREKNYALALIIATMCDEDTYQMVARKFADDVLSAGSPLYTTALLLTDNLPLPPGHVLRDNPRHGLSFWCEDPYQDLDTNWTQQLATILSNKRGNYTKIIMTLGDRLMQLGHCHAAHVCYLATSLSLNNPSKPSTRMVLLGCDHTVPLNRVLMTPEAVEAFERSEAFEWARRLGNKRTSFSALQPFKLRYAELLADVGHEVLAREYLLSIRMCTGIGIITRSKGNPASSYDSGFVQSLRELDDRICGSTGAERSSWNANEESSKGSLFSLGRLSALVRGKESKEEEVLTPRPESEVDPLLELDATAPPATQSGKEEVVPAAVTKPKEEPTEPPKETGALNTSIGISNDAKQASTIDDAPASAPPSLAIGESVIDRAEDSKRNEEKLSEKLSTPSEPIKKDAKKKAPASEPPASAGLLARLFGRDKNVKVADQGEEMQAYYDDKLKRWIFPGDDPAEVAKPLAPPPIMKSTDKAPSTPAPAPAASNDPLAALMAPPSRATSAKKGLPPTMSRYADPLASMGNMSMSTPGASMKKDAAHAAPTPKFAVFQPIPTKPDPSKDEKENVAAS